MKIEADGRELCCAVVCYNLVSPLDGRSNVNVSISYNNIKPCRQNEDKSNLLITKMTLIDS